MHFGDQCKQEQRGMRHPGDIKIARRDQETGKSCSMAEAESVHAGSKAQAVAQRA